MTGTSNAVNGPEAAPYLAKSGGTMTGALNMGSHLINSVTDPVSAQDAATKNYVDQTALNGTSVYAASAASLGTVTQSGAGVGATLTNAGAQATFALDGVNPPAGSNVLIKNTAVGMTAANEGIYTVTNVGSGSTNWVLTRATSYDTATEINNTGLIAIQNGSSLSGTAWYNTATIVTVDTTSLNYAQFGSSQFSQIVETLVTSTQAFTPNANTKYIAWRSVGGGGGGGGVAAGGAGTSAAAESGASAGYNEGICTRATWIGAGTAATITIGAAGTGGAAGHNNGSDGGNTTIVANSGAGATLSTANGGGGGLSNNASGSNTAAGGNGVGGTASGGTLSISGSNSGTGITLSVGAAALSTQGGSTPMGNGASINTGGPGQPGTGYGTGGGGGVTLAATDRAGGNGGPGAVFLTEYI